MTQEFSHAPEIILEPLKISLEALKFSPEAPKISPEAPKIFLEALHDCQRLPQNNEQRRVNLVTTCDNLK